MLIYLFLFPYHNLANKFHTDHTDSNLAYDFHNSHNPSITAWNMLFMDK